MRKKNKQNPKLAEGKGGNKVIMQKIYEHLIAKINKTKSWFFEKINKIDKPLARLITKKGEKTQINRTRNEKGEVTAATAELQRIMRDYYSNYMPIKWTT